MKPQTANASLVVASSNASPHPTDGPPGLMRAEIEQLSDVEIVHRIKGGDRELFGALYEMYFERLWTFAYRYVRESEVAQDLVQDVFMRIWASRGHWDINISIKTYLFAATRHQAFNVLAHRSVQSKAHGHHDITAFSFAVPEPSPQLRIEHAEMRQVLSAAIARLPERQRIALTLRLEQEMTQQEIALVLGLSQPAVAKLLTRAGLVIKSAIEEFGVMPE